MSFFIVYRTYLFTILDVATVFVINKINNTNKNESRVFRWKEDDTIYIKFHENLTYAHKGFKKIKVKNNIADN